MNYKETEEIENIIIKEINQENDIRGYKFKNCVENIITDMFKTTRILALKMYEYRKIGSVEKIQQKF